MDDKIIDNISSGEAAPPPHHGGGVPGTSSEGAEVTSVPQGGGEVGQSTNANIASGSTSSPRRTRLSGAARRK